MNTAVLLTMQELWETSDLTAEQIGAQLGVTKNAVVGQASRRGWVKGNDHSRSAAGRYAEPEPITMMQRLQKMHDRMDQVLRECIPHQPELAALLRSPIPPPKPSTRGHYR